jgi:hypothetical protein
MSEAAMHPVIQTLRSGIAYATFENADVKEAVDNLVNILGYDLEVAEYEPATKTDVSAAELEKVLNEADKEVEDEDDEDDDDNEDDDED